MAARVPEPGVPRIVSIDTRTARLRSRAALEGGPWGRA